MTNKNRTKPAPAAIDNVEHYHGDEVMTVIENYDLDDGFCKGSIVKYVLRAGLKPETSELDDLKKAQWYLDRLIKRKESQG